MVCPFPGYDKKYISRISAANGYKYVQTYLSDYLFCLMFMRIYFIFKWRFNTDIYNDAFSKQLCKDNGFYPSYWFIMKTKFLKRPTFTVFVIFIFSLFTLAFMVVTFEIDNLIEYSSNG